MKTIIARHFAIRLLPFVVLCVLCAVGMSQTALLAAENRSETTIMLDRAQSKMVKIYGAGGFRDLEAYQSGILISSEGHILTAYSHVLDTDEIAVLLERRPKIRGKTFRR